MQPHARTHEPNRCETQRVRPCGVVSLACLARLVALPYAEGRRHGEESLDHRTEEEPQTSLGPDTVTDTAEEGSKDECKDRGEGLLIGEVERAVAFTEGVVEETCEGECKLQCGFAGVRDGASSVRGKLDLPGLCCPSGKHTTQRWQRNKSHRCFAYQHKRVTQEEERVRT